MTKLTCSQTPFPFPQQQTPTTTMKPLSFLIALTLTFLLWTIAPTATNNSAIAAENPSNCSNISQIIDSTLQIHYSPECLEEKLHLSDLLAVLEVPINEQTGDQLEVSNLTYSLTDDGIRLQTDILLHIKPLLDNVAVTASQDLSASIEKGTLHLKAGKTDIKTSKLLIKAARGIISQKIDEKLSQFDGKQLDQLLAQYELDAIAEPIGISPEAIDFAIKAIEKKIDLNLDGSGLTLAITIN